VRVAVDKQVHKDTADEAAIREALTSSYKWSNAMVDDFLRLLARTKVLRKAAER
jgi:hypothetical protein